MKTKMKNRSHRYDMNRPWPKHGHKYTKYKDCPNIMMPTCIKQQLRNMWSSILEKLSSTEAEMKKSVAYKKKCVNCR